MNKNRIISIVMTLLLLTTLFVGCSSEKEGARGSNSEEVVIGFIGPLSGEVASYGNSTKNGVELALAKADTVLGKKIAFTPYDDAGDPTKATNAYNKLKGKGMTALVGTVTSTPALSVAPLAASDNIPMVAPTATANDVTKAGKSVFRACFLDEYQASRMADYAVTEMGKKKIAILYRNDDDYYIGLKESFEKTAKEKGAEIVAIETYGKGDADFSAQLTSIASKNPDALYIPEYYETSCAIITQARKIAALKDIDLMGGDGWDGLLGVDGVDASVLNNCYFSNHYSTEDTSDVVQNFLKDYKEKYNADPSSFAALGYDSAMIVVKAIEKAGSTGHDKVVEALKGLTYEGVTGTITFDENGDPIKSVSIIKIVDGKYTLESKF